MNKGADRCTRANQTNIAALWSSCSIRADTLTAVAIQPLTNETHIMCTPSSPGCTTTSSASSVARMVVSFCPYAASHFIDAASSELMSPFDASIIALRALLDCYSTNFCEHAQQHAQRTSLQVESASTERIEMPLLFAQAGCQRRAVQALFRRELHVAALLSLPCQWIWVRHLCRQHA